MTTGFHLYLSIGNIVFSGETQKSANVSFVCLFCFAVMLTSVVFACEMFRLVFGVIGHNLWTWSF